MFILYCLHILVLYQTMSYIGVFFFPLESMRAKGRGRIEMTTLAGPRSQKAVSRCRRKIESGSSKARSSEGWAGIEKRTNQYHSSLGIDTKDTVALCDSTRNQS